MTAGYIVVAAFLLAWLTLDRTWKWTGLRIRREEVPGSFTLLAPGGQAAVLMLHETGGSPESLRVQAERLQKAGFYVRVPALPGTSPEDPPHPAAWLPSAREELNALRKSHREVFLFGASTGGSVCLALAAENSVAGIVTVATPLSLFNRDFRRPVKRNLMVLFSALFALLFRRLKTARQRPEAEAIEGGTGSEDRLTPAAVHAQKVFLRGLRRQLRKVKAPILAIHARSDRTTDFRNAARILRSVSSKRKENLEIPLAADDPTRRHRLCTHRDARDAVAEAAAAFYLSLKTEIR